MPQLGSPELQSQVIRYLFPAPSSQKTGMRTLVATSTPQPFPFRQTLLMSLSLRFSGCKVSSTSLSKLSFPSGFRVEDTKGFVVALGAILRNNPPFGAGKSFNPLRNSRVTISSPRQRFRTLYTSGLLKRSSEIRCLSRSPRKRARKMARCQRLTMRCWLKLLTSCEENELAPSTERKWSSSKTQTTMTPFSPRARWRWRTGTGAGAAGTTGIRYSKGNDPGPIWLGGERGAHHRRRRGRGCALPRGGPWGLLYTPDTYNSTSHDVSYYRLPPERPPFQTRRLLIYVACV